MAPRGRRARGGRNLDRDGDVSMGVANSPRSQRSRNSNKGPRTDREGDVAMGSTGQPKHRRGRSHRGGDGPARGGVHKDKNKSRSKPSHRGRGGVDTTRIEKHLADASHKELVSGVSKDGQALKAKIMAMLDRRYNPATKLLDLSQLGSDSEWDGTGMFDVQRGQKFFMALMSVCGQAFTDAQQKRDSVESVSLTGNQLANLRDVATLAQTFPDLKNLDLSNNNFHTVSDLNAFRRKFKSLQQIYIGQCPLMEKHPEARNEIKKWFPSLLVIDGIPAKMEIPPGWGVSAPGKSEDQVKKEFLEIEFMKVTNLNLSFAQQCLQQNNYIPEAAMKAFEDAKGRLSPEAFN